MDARTEPPSEQHVAEARAAGHVAAPWLVSPALSLAAGLFALSLLLEPATQRLQGMLRTPLERLARGELPAAADHAREALDGFAPLLGLTLASMASLGALGTLLTQGIQFHLRRPKPRASIAKLRHPRAVVFLLSLVASLVVVGSVAFEALRVTPASVSALFSRGLFRAAAALLLVAASDAAFARAAFMRSLWMTRRDKQEQMREAYGSVEMQRARARARRELGRPS